MKSLLKQHKLLQESEENFPILCLVLRLILQDLMDATDAFEIAEMLHYQLELTSHLSTDTAIAAVLVVLAISKRLSDFKRGQFYLERLDEELDHVQVLDVHELYITE